MLITVSNPISSTPFATVTASYQLLPQPQSPQSPNLLYQFCFFSNVRSHPTRPNGVDVRARAQQMQNLPLWTYALTFSCITGFIVIIRDNFQDQLVFYVTPSEAIEKYQSNPSKKKFTLWGLVLEGSVVHPTSSPKMEFVVTNLVIDILVRYQGSLPDFFREGHSVVEGFVELITEEINNVKWEKSVSKDARNRDYYFLALEVLAKHDEKLSQRLRRISWCWMSSSRELNNCNLIFD